MRIYISPKVADKKSLIEGEGVFAVEDIEKGETILDLSTIEDKKIIDAKEADRLFSEGFDYMLQIGDDSFLVTHEKGDPEIYSRINHSCSPNCGVKNSLTFVAMRDIKKDEEITFDYVMTESSEYRFMCNCGYGGCRRMITGGDWRIPELQKKYAGYFSEYLKKKM